MRYYIKAFKNYLQTDGRAARKELWVFAIFQHLILACLAFLDGLFGLHPENINYGYLTLAYILISVCPGFCLIVRRLHDVGKSGGWVLAAFVPFLNLYLLYLLYFKRGSGVYNVYGPPPVNEKSRKKAVNQPAIPKEQYLTQEFGQKKFVVNQETGEVVSETTVAPQKTVDNQTIPQNPPQIKFCRKCGFELIEDSRFCSHCGTEVLKES